MVSRTLVRIAVGEKIELLVGEENGAPAKPRQARAEDERKGGACQSERDSGRCQPPPPQTCPDRHCQHGGSQQGERNTPVSWIHRQYPPQEVEIRDVLAIRRQWLIAELP